MNVSINNILSDQYHCHIIKAQVDLEILYLIKSICCRYIIALTEEQYIQTVL